MKKLLIGAFALCCIISLAGCDKATTNESGTTPPKETAVPLELDRRLACVNEVSTIDKLHIESGNGGYHIVYPKQIYVGQQVAYSDDYMRLSIDDDNNIVVEYKLSERQFLYGLFIVKDAKGEKRLFVVDNPDWIGDLYDFDELEGRYLNDPDYWQE